MIVASSHPLDKIKDAEKSKLNTAETKDAIEKLQGAESSSIYHSLPMPFVNYPFPFVNTYTTRYFPYGYAGLGYGAVAHGLGPFGYGFGFGHYV